MSCTETALQIHSNLVVDTRETPDTASRLIRNCRALSRRYVFRLCQPTLVIDVKVFDI